MSLPLWLLPVEYGIRYNALLSLPGPSLQHLILFETLVNKYSRLNVAIVSFLVANTHIVCRILRWLFPPI